MNKKIHILVIVLIFIVFLNSVFADPSFYAKKDESYDFKIYCKNSSYSQCDSSTNCYLTIDYPNSVNMINNQTMSNSGVYFNYTLNSSLLNVESCFYSFNIDCSGEKNGFKNGYFCVTFSGNERQETNRTAMILGFITTIVFFAWMGIANDNRGVKIFAFGLSFIELIFMIGTMYASETGMIMTSLLKVNFYSMLILGFGVGIYTLNNYYRKILEEDELKKTGKWERNTKW